jgi:hypothetical protein
MHHTRRNPGRFVRVFAAGVVISLLLTGCKSNKRYDLLEAELRTRNRELAEARQALDQSRTINRAYESAQGSALPGTPVHPVSAGTGAGCPVREIALGRGTGGVDDDGAPGDECLMVVIVPTDEDRSAVKVPARATVAAWEVTTQGIKTPIGAWEVPADRLRPTWRSGLLATGYFVSLPWQTYPTTNKVRVAVRLTTTDGRVFEADRDVLVNPVPQAIPIAPVLPYPITPGVPYPAPPVPTPGREPLLPGTPPPGVPSVLPPGVEELPPPMGLPQGRGAQLLPPVKQ